MPTNGSDSSKPGWRGKDKTPAPMGRPAAAKGGLWSQKRDRSHEQAVLRHRLRLAGWGFLFLVLIVGFTIWLIWTPKRTPMLVAAVTDYDSPLPPNAWAKEDIDRLFDLDKEEIIGFSKIVADPPKVYARNPEDLKQNLAAQLQKVIGAKSSFGGYGGPSKDLVIIYLSAHGAVNKDNEPCLLTSETELAESDNWYKVKQLLNDLFPEGKREQWPKKTLLILDCNRIRANWSAGLLYNDFARQLQKVVQDKQAGYPGLAVLNSAGPGQIGWAAQELQGSVFGYYLWQGLRGAANAGKTGGNDDKYVSLSELYAFLCDRVNQWAAQNRGDVQVPMLMARDRNWTIDKQGRAVLDDGKDIPRSDDWLLVYAKDAGEASPPKYSRDDNSWAEIHSYWKRHAALEQKIPRRQNPLEWAQLQHKLLRLEQLIQAGAAYRTQYNSAKNEVKNLLRNLETDQSDQNPVAYSLPLARRWNPLSADEETKNKPSPSNVTSGKSGAGAGTKESPAESARKSADKSKEGSGNTGEKTAETTGKTEKAEEKPAETKEKPADGDKNKPLAESKGKPPEQPSPPPAVETNPDAPRVNSYLAATRAAWKKSLENALRFDESRKNTLDVIDRAERQPPADVVEVHFLRMLDKYLNPDLWATDYVRLALQARDMAEQAAAPADERVQYWIEPMVDRADGLRRRAEDELFIGDESSLSDAVGNVWPQLLGEQGDYNKALKQANELAKAFELRDRAWAELPYLVEWQLTSPDVAGNNPLETSSELIESLRNLTADLDKALEDAAKGGKLPADFSVRVNEISGKLRNLKRNFEAKCAELKSERGSDTQTLRSIADALEIPLVSGDTRERLRDIYLGIAQQKIAVVHPDGVANALRGGAGKSGDQENPQSADNYLDRLNSWKKHPALMILDREGLGPNPPTDRSTEGRSTERRDIEGREKPTRETQLKILAQEGEEVRRLLKNVFVEATSRAKYTTDELDRGEKTVAGGRKGLSQADYLVRAAAPLLTRSWEKGKDPTHQLYDLDLHNLLLWHAQRALDDFWGPKPGEATPYFTIVAEDYLKSANRYFGPAPRRRGDELRNRLAERNKAARQAVLPDKPEGVFFDEPDASKPAADEKRTPIERTQTIKIAENLPAGQAAFYLQDSGGSAFPMLNRVENKELPVGRMAVPDVQSARSLELKYLLPDDDRLRSTSLLRAVALYRGHVRAGDIAVAPSTGLDIVWKAPKSSPSIVVQGDTQKRVAIMFILDCSGSMGKTDVGSGESRLDAAKKCLKTVLKTLAKSAPQQAYQVGLCLYGHRVGMKNNRMVIRNPNYRPGDPDDYYVIEKPDNINIHPSEDVEFVLKMAQFNEEAYYKVEQKLNTVENLGFTPLYLAIMQSVEEMRNVAGADKKLIVAITDGKNEQYTVALPAEKIPGVIKSLGNVDASLNENPSVHLDVVGIGPDIKEPDAQEFERLAKDHRGRYYSANDVGRLLGALRKSTGIVQYDVLRERPDGGEEMIAGPLELNEKCRIPAPIGRPVLYNVRLTDQQPPVEQEVVVECDEGMELFVRDDLGTGVRRLVHGRYLIDKRDALLSAPVEIKDDYFLPRGLKDKKRMTFFIEAHLPKYNGNAARFYVSVQNGAEEQFSPRPAEAWAEIRPVLPEKHADAAVYNFYDLSYEPGKPVPMLTYLAPKWPAEAKQADIRLWFKLEKTQPDKDLPVAEFLRGKTISVNDGKGEVKFNIAAKRGKTSIDPYRLIVTESHPPGSELGTVKVTMDHTPEKIVHRHDYKNNSVTHTFYYDDSKALDIETYRVQITTLDRLKDEAISASRPLQVIVPVD